MPFGNVTKKLPPFGKAAANSPTPNGSDIIICTGSDGFQRARESQTNNWFPRLYKLALPFGAQPEDYAWPVNAHVAVLWPFGTPESMAVIDRLATLCLRYGPRKALYFGRDAMRRYLPQGGTNE